MKDVHKARKQYVALRKESVDRNTAVIILPHINMKSLSARRAWIEIEFEVVILEENDVALRKESVDRNFTDSVFF